MTLHEYDVVALTAEIQAIHKETSGQILLRPGQVGTILMSFDDRTYLVLLTRQTLNGIRWLQWYVKKLREEKRFHLMRFFQHKNEIKCYKVISHAARESSCISSGTSR